MSAEAERKAAGVQDEVEYVESPALGFTPTDAFETTITVTERHAAPLPPAYSHNLLFETRTPGKGRPRVWSRDKLLLLTQRIVADYYRKKYRAPTLRQVADEIDRRDIAPMSEEALKKLFQRYGLKWSELKRKTGT